MRLSLGLSGFGFWSHDIGGFENTAPAHVYKRWCAFGLLSSHSRLHGSKSYRVPWAYDDQACDVVRFFTEWKCRLMPYLYAASAQARDTGSPVIRAMMLEFPDDPGCDYLDRQYMLGDSLLVAPVFSENGDVSVYLPTGRWTHLYTNQEVTGGWRKERHDFNSLPLYVRPNSLIAIGNNSQKPDYDYADGTVFHLFVLEDGALAQAVIPAADGSTQFTLSVRREGKQLHVSSTGNARNWSLCLRNIHSVSAATNGSVQSDEMGIIVIPQQGCSELTVSLK